MFNRNEIVETITMIEQENLDIRTITMGISLRDCAARDGGGGAPADLRQDRPAVPTSWCRRARTIEREFGIPIINTRISVTPISHGGREPATRPTTRASPRRWTRRRKTVGVNFIGGFSALVHKGFTKGDRRLIGLHRRRRWPRRARLRLGQRGHHQAPASIWTRCARWAG